MTDTPLDLLKSEQRRRSLNLIASYFPDEGPLRRELYQKHLEFFTAGAAHRQRAAICANRVGKSQGIGAYELSCHLTGRYPPWWNGRRFNKPVTAWAAGDTARTVHDIIEAKLVGKPGARGTGMIPGELIQKTTARMGLTDAIETVYVKHASSGTSLLTLKSYEQGREVFQGTEIDVGWLDEEFPEAIYTETLTRTMTTGGILLMTFTPLRGLTPFIASIQEGGDRHGTVYIVTCTWDDVPHLDERAKAELLASYPVHQRDARTKGIPALGAGAIYPVPEEQFVIEPFPIPPHYPRGYGLDVGWRWTGAVWGAHDRDADIVYFIHEHKRAEEDPITNSAAIKAKGIWIPGKIDPAARGRGQADGIRLTSKYADQGLELQLAQNAVEAGIHEVWTRLIDGRLKVFASLQQWLKEFRVYRRDEKGKVVKHDDHLQDAGRYLLLGDLGWMRTNTPPAPPKQEWFTPGQAGQGWMA